jgi:hypothetical protein
MVYSIYRGVESSFFEQGKKSENIVDVMLDKWCSGEPRGKSLCKPRGQLFFGARRQNETSIRHSRGKSIEVSRCRIDGPEVWLIL